MSTKRNALIAGATGLIGRQLLRQLLEDQSYAAVHSIGRSTSGVEHERLREWIVDFDALDQYREPLEVDDVYCCLGTTMKKAGSKEAFRKVDYTYVVQLAKAALRGGATAFSMVSAMGADAGSMFFYNRVKGETEKALEALGYDALRIFRPSLLLGDRDETRVGEEIGGVFLGIVKPLMVGSLRKYRPIQGMTVATAMLAASGLPGERQIFESDRIEQLAREKENV